MRIPFTKHNFNYQVNGNRTLYVSLCRSKCITRMCHITDRKTIVGMKNGKPFQGFVIEIVSLFICHAHLYLGDRDISRKREDTEVCILEMSI